MLRRHLDTKETTHGTFLLFHHTSEFWEIDSDPAGDEFCRLFFCAWLLFHRYSTVPPRVHADSVGSRTFVRLKVKMDSVCCSL